MDKEISSFQMNLLGPYILAPEVYKERLEVYKYYNFFYGKARISENEFLTDQNKGQSWQVKSDLDFTPSQDIRNHVKRIIKRQARFMFGTPPTITIKGYKKEDNDLAEGLRQFIDSELFEKNEFWKNTKKAFLDCTICKRVLLRVQANPGSEVTFHYHSMDEFTYEVDPKDYSKLKKVTIAYLEKKTAFKSESEQIWYRWQYEMHDDGYCYLTSGTYDGFAKPIEETNKDFNTMFDEIPCKVILNDSLLGDLQGDSDIRDLMDLQDTYNRTNSDYKDALKFKMFEQPVFIDASEDSTDDIKIAPNAMIDLHTDPTLENGKADAKMLSGSFSFSDATKKFTDDIKTDMYEIMDQPKPDDLKALTSGKALKMSFYDLMARCDDKWTEWESAIKWAINFSRKAIIQLGLYPDEWDKQWDDLKYKVNIKHNYPIPDDEHETKSIALQEVNAHVRSIESYIKNISDEEDYETEYKKIIEDIEKIKTASEDSLEPELRSELDGADESLDKINNSNSNLNNIEKPVEDDSTVDDKNKKPSTTIIDYKGNE